MSGLTLLRPGTVFAGDYRIVRPLKEGGMGAVYLAEQISTSEQRAIKVMQPSLVDKLDARRRFEREARVGAQIKSDFVVKVIQAGVDEPTSMPWLAMELLEGEDLESYLGKTTRIPPLDVIEIFDQLCDAVGAAHRAGIVHRDLKPENIFLAIPRRRRDRFHVKVLDFGVARLIAEVQTTSSKTRGALGTPLYMAPEQAQPGSPIDARTDVWALGLIAFRLLTGRYFWRTAYAESPTVIMIAMEAFVEPLPAASSRAAQWGAAEAILPAFDAWFARCVCRDPAGRFADAAQAFAALARIYQVSAQTAPALVAPDFSGSAPAGLPVAQITQPSPAGRTEQMPPGSTAGHPAPTLASPAQRFGSTSQSAAQWVTPPAVSARSPASNTPIFVVMASLLSACVIGALWFTMTRANRNTPSDPAASDPSSPIPGLSAARPAPASVGGAGTGDVPPAAPKSTGGSGSASIGGAPASPGGGSNASAVVAAMTPAFRRCYRQGLVEDPKMKGSVLITARLGPNGEVISAVPSGGSGLSSTVVSCLTAQVASAQFSPPEGGRNSVAIPLSFKPD